MSRRSVVGRARSVVQAVAVGVVGAVTATLVPAVAPGPTAQAAPDDVVALVLHGTGNGHGRGMSQWGAYGYAVDHGWEWEEILDHYYGGTTNGTTSAGQRIRVRLLGYDGLGTVGVISHGAGVGWNGTTAPAMRAVETSPGTFRIDAADKVACPAATSLSVPDGPIGKNPGTYVAAVTQIQAFLKSFQDGSIVVDGYFGNQTESVLAAWQQSWGLPVNGALWDADDANTARGQINASTVSVNWTTVGTHVQSVGNPVRFTSAGMDDGGVDRNLVLGACRGSGSVTHYRGAIEVVHTSSGNRVVSDVTAENYLRGVVPKEISASWAAAGGGAGVHAVRAQAVAARSYGLEQNRSYNYDGTSTRYATTCDTTSCQVYAGSARRSSATGSATRVEQDATDAAIAATANVVRVWPDDSIVSTEFSASNGPRTAGGAFPPVNDIGDDTEPNPLHKWTRIIDADDFAVRHGLGRITNAYMTETNSSNYKGFDGIWFDDIVVEGTSGTFRQQAWDFRNANGLRSPGFTVEVITRDTTSTSFGLIGDSVGNSIAGSTGSEFRRLTDGTFVSADIDVVDSRCTTKTVCPGTSGVEAVADLPRDLDLVVVELGYNDNPADFAADIDAMMTAFVERGVRRVAWVNMAEIRTVNGQSFYPPANDALANAEAKWPTLTVLDWESYSDNPERPRWFSDGVHLTTTGQAEFALWLREQVLELSPAHYLAPPRRIVLPVVGQTLTAPDGSILTVPENATGVALNVAVVRPVGSGYGTVWPCQAEPPLVSSINYERDDIKSNSVVAPVSEDGTVCLYSSQGTNIVVDLAGWFTGSNGGESVDPFVGLLPERRVDTREGIGGPAFRVTPESPISIPVAGTPATLPDGTSTTVPADAAAAAMNVAVVRADRNGYITLWPCGTEMPLAANVNYPAGAVVSNGVIAPLGTEGRVCLYSSAPADLVVDINGYFDGSLGDENALTDPAFRAATPTRLVDTRIGVGSPTARVSPATPLELRVRGAELVDPSAPAIPLVVPEGASAVALNLAIVKPDGNGYGTVWPCNEPMPTTANVNFRAGVNISNGVVAPIGSGGRICVHLSAPADVVMDVAGWFRGGDSASFVGAVPQRVVDTRIAIGPVPT